MAAPKLKIPFKSWSPLQGEKMTREQLEKKKIYLEQKITKFEQIIINQTDKSVERKIFNRLDRLHDKVTNINAEIVAL